MATPAPTPRAPVVGPSKPRLFKLLGPGLATGLGIALNLAQVDPIRALFWSAVINGVAAVPVMACMMLLATRRRIMGPAVVSRMLLAVGWLATAVMAAAAVAMVL